MATPAPDPTAPPIPPDPATLPGMLSREDIFRAIDARNAQWQFETCGQQSFWALQAQFQLGSAESDGMPALLAFGSDAALATGTCAAMVGCLVALGLAFGPWYEDVAAPAQEFLRRFLEWAGSTLCAEIQASLSRRPTGSSGAAGAGGQVPADWVQHCLSCVRAADRAAAEVIMDWPRGSGSTQRQPPVYGSARLCGLHDVHSSSSVPA